MRKYEEIEVSKQVNISSSGDYHFKVYWNGGMRDYSLGVGFLANSSYVYTWKGAPKYLEDEVERQIVEMFWDGTAVFYEYDRDHIKRYENLRYRNQELEASYVEDWRKHNTG